MRYLSSILLLVLLAGCAESPPGAGRTVREISFRITFAGPVDDNAYYMIPIDTGGGEGPLPVFPRPDDATGDEWVTGSAEYFVQYHARRYTLYRITNLHPFAYEPVGTPVRSTLPTGNALAFTLDLDDLGVLESLDVNVIALNRLSPDGRLLDGLGDRGNDFLSVPITSDRTFGNSGLEGPGDVLDENGLPQPAESIDIVDFSISVDV
ncbi:MAG: hypothetical protein ACYC2Y_01520 [Armatimonadota bacterium]